MKLTNNRHNEPVDQNNRSPSVILVKLNKDLNCNKMKNIFYSELTSGSVSSNS